MTTAREKGELNRRAIVVFFASHRDWIATKTISTATGQHVNTVHVHCRNLIAMGYLEESLIWIDYSNTRNGRSVIHYRLRTTAVKSSHGR